jgi:hypothetical protein
MRKITYPSIQIFDISPCKDCPENLTEKSGEITSETPVEVICKTNECFKDIIGFEYVQKVELKKEPYNPKD